MTTAALQGEDNECLRIMAEEFQKPRAGLMDHIYWKDLDQEMKPHAKESPDMGGPPDPECMVM